ncbi:outer membrane lipoprotein carrier protein LolA [Kitasatospora sp. NPDC048365]|uniref:LolA family protein n=1 Tax=Kitasatospora sp. NPDC048365 TaxID=3364050 RepID=UPI0037114A73
MLENEDTAQAPQQTPHRARRRTAVRVAVPVAVAAAVATGVGLVPALASDSAPSLPAVSAEQLVAKVLSADTDTLSGTVKISADLGLPSQLLSMAGGASPVPGLDLGRAGGGSGGGGIGGTGIAPTGKALELLGGEHVITVAADGPDRQRVVLPGGYQLVHNGDQFWAFDGKRNEGVHGVLPAEGKDGGKEARRGPEAGVPTPQELAKRFLSASAGTTTVTVDGTEKVADRAAYRLSVKPAQQGSTIAEVRISVDAERGVPLGVQVRTVDGSKVFDAHFGTVDFAAPSAKTFEFTAPKGAKVTEQGDAKEHSGEIAAALEQAKQEAAKQGAKPDGAGPDTKVIGEGWTSVLSVAGGGQEVGSAVKMLGKPVGGGTLISTKVVNVLVTDDGRLFAGAVTLPTLQNAAK